MLNDWRSKACSLFPVIPEIDIWRAANLMLKRYGDKVLEESAARADELAAQDDYNGEAVWRSSPTRRQPGRSTDYVLSLRRQSPWQRKVLRRQVFAHRENAEIELTSVSRPPAPVRANGGGISYRFSNPMILLHLPLLDFLAGIIYSLYGRINIGTPCRRTTPCSRRPRPPS